MANKMHEFLKTVKRAYTYYLIFCSLAIGISISIKDSGTINKAINELLSFNNFNLKLSNEIISDTLQSVREQSIKSKKSLISDKFHQIMEKYKDYNYGYSADFSQTYASPEYPFEEGYEKNTLSELAATLIKLNDKKIKFYLPEVNDFNKKLNSVLLSLTDQNKKYISYKNLQYDPDINLFNFHLSIFHDYDWDKDIKLDKEDKIIQIKAELIECNYSWLDLLVSIGQVNKFIEKLDNNNFVVYPFMRNYWQNVKDANPNNAFERLIEIRRNTPIKHTITLLGIEINLNPMKYIGQIIIVFLFLYYYLHLSYFTHRRPNKETLEYFPWIAIYNGNLPKIITFCFTFILPSASIIVITSGFWTDDKLSNLYSLLISIIALIIVTFLGILIHKLLGELRK